MNKEIMNLIDNLGGDALAAYLTANYGERFGLYADGIYLVGQDVGREISKDERPLVSIACPGVDQIDRSWWTEGWTEELENGNYLADDGRELTFAQCVCDCCKNGDIDDELKSFKDELIKDVENEDSRSKLFGE